MEAFLRKISGAHHKYPIDEKIKQLEKSLRVYYKT